MSASPSLRELDSIPDRIRQHRQADKRGTLVVEGRSDELLLRRIGVEWVLFIAGTRASVVDAVTGAASIGVARVAGLVDADFDDLRTSIDASDQVFTYEEADLEAVLVAGQWFEWLVAEHGSDRKLRSNGGAGHLRELCIDIARQVGRLRSANAAAGWGLHFDGSPLHSKVKPTTLAFNLVGYCTSLAATSGRKVTSQELVSLTERDDANMRTDDFRGRDALHVTYVALRRVFGSSQLRDPEDLARALRLAADKTLLSEPPFPSIGAALA